MTENNFDIEKDVNPTVAEPSEAPAAGTDSADTIKNIADSIADINSAAAVTVTAIAPAKKEKKRKKKDEYRVSNWDIIVNYRHYTDSERKHYRYVFTKRLSGYVWPVFRACIIFGLAFVILYPILYMISTSIRPQIEMSDPSVMWIPKSIRWSNFTEVWAALDYPKTIGNTLLLNVVSSMLQVVTCAITGYGFARFKFKGQGLCFAIVILQIIVPAQIILIPQFMQFRYFDIFGLFNALTGESINLVDTPFALYIPALFVNGIRAGLFVFLFRQFFKGLPKELEDAAYLDGCGPLRTFVQIMVPNAASSFLTVFIFSIVWYWNDFYVSSMFFSNPDTISLKINNIATIVSLHLTGEVGIASDFVVWMEAGCLLAIAPIVIMYIFLQKYFVEGIARSGIAN